MPVVEKFSGYGVVREPVGVELDVVVGFDVEGDDSRRIASVKVGWKRLPLEECFSLCVGRTWP